MLPQAAPPSPPRPAAGFQLQRLVLAVLASLLLHAMLSLIRLPGRPSLSATGSARVHVALDKPQRTPAARHTTLPSPTAEPGGRTQHEPAGTGLLPPRRYYTSLELSESPRPLAPVDLLPPADATQPASAILRLFISETGAVEGAEVLMSEGDKDFARSAQQSFSAAQFAPGERDGVPVPVRMVVEVRFDPEPPETAASGPAR